MKCFLLKNFQKKTCCIDCSKSKAYIESESECLCLCCVFCLLSSASVSAFLKDEVFSTESSKVDLNKKKFTCWCSWFAVWCDVQKRKKRGFKVTILLEMCSRKELSVWVRSHSYLLEKQQQQYPWKKDRHYNYIKHSHWLLTSSHTKKRKKLVSHSLECHMNVCRKEKWCLLSKRCII